MCTAMVVASVVEQAALLAEAVLVTNSAEELVAAVRAAMRGPAAAVRVVKAAPEVGMVEQVAMEAALEVGETAAALVAEVTVVGATAETVVGEVEAAMVGTRAEAMVAEVMLVGATAEAETEAGQSIQGGSKFLQWSPPTCQEMFLQASANDN
jgi:hypothetical protein